MGGYCTSGKPFVLVVVSWPGLLNIFWQSECNCKHYWSNKWMSEFWILSSALHIEVYHLYCYFGNTIHIIHSLSNNTSDDTLLPKIRVFYNIWGTNIPKIPRNLHIFRGFWSKMRQDIYHWHISNIVPCVSWYISYFYKWKIWNPTLYYTIITNLSITQYKVVIHMPM